MTRKRGFIGCLFVLVLAAFFIGSGALLYYGAREVRRAKESPSWPTTEGKVLLSELAHNTNNENQTTTYKASIVYVYTVNQHEYTASQISFGEMQTSDPKDAYAILRRYPKDTTVTVHYLPSSPDVAVLEPGTSWTCYLLLALGVLFLFGDLALIAAGVGIWYFIRAQSKKKPHP